MRFYCAGLETTCDAAKAEGEYRYDGAGNRVLKIVGARQTTYVYDAFGKLAAEYSNLPPPAGVEGGRFFRTTDHLGSTRLTTRADGTVYRRSDFYPFGEPILANAGTNNRQLVLDGGTQTTYTTFDAEKSFQQQFTEKERDEESNLDYFLARYYSSTLGRFTSVDLVAPDPMNPQTPNKFRYSLNNPLRFVDPDGLYQRDVHQDLTAALGGAAGATCCCVKSW